jgi:hypothetical protein
MSAAARAHTGFLPLFEAMQAMLTLNNPKVRTPRVVNDPILLTGLVVCATCGSCMNRIGTRHRNRSYSYYTCGRCHRKDPSVCKERYIPPTKLYDLILSNPKEQLLVPERREDILGKLLERRTSR